MSNLYRCRISADFSPNGWNGGGIHIVYGFKSGGYGWQEAKSYWGYTYTRYCNDGVWTGWDRYLTNTDVTGINYIANLSSINGLTAPGTYTVNGNGAYGKSGMPSDIATSGILVNYVSLGQYYAQDIICNGIRYSRCSPGTPLTSSHGWLKYTTGGITSVSAR